MRTPGEGLAYRVGPKVTKKQKRKRYTDDKTKVLRAAKARGQRTIAEVATSLGVRRATRSLLEEQIERGDLAE